MTPLSPATLDRPAGKPDVVDKPAPPAAPYDTAIRGVVSAALFLAYLQFRVPLVELLQRSVGTALKPETVGVGLVAAVIAAVVWIWRKTLAKDKRFHAPLLITSILLVGDAAFGILLSHHSEFLKWLTGGKVTTYSPTFVAILTTVTAEMALGRYYHGKWPHLASAYVSGISAGILTKSPDLWPFVMVGLISITSKYVLRIGDRHLWNPTNFGMTMMLSLAANHMASLSVEAGNEIWAPLVIWILGSMILYQLKLFHISLAFIATFLPLAFFRAWWTGHAVLTELAPMTHPMFQLYIFFMITDPKTITKRRWTQVAVAVIIALVETFYRLAFEDKYSLYHALFTVGPIAVVAEIVYTRYFAATPKSA